MASSPPQLTLVDALAQLSFLVHRLLERRAGERDLSIVQMRLLGVLRDRRPTINELAAVLELDKSSASGLVDRARRRGLVTRAPSADDGRAVIVSLTPDGHALAAEVARRFEDDVRALVRDWPTADATALRRLVSGLLVGEAARRGIELFPPAD